jgi:DNA-binding NarL/FixJ family response regulator
MNIVILTPVRILGDGLASYFSTVAGTNNVIVVREIASLRDYLVNMEIQVVLIDVTQGIDLFDVRAIAAQWPRVPLVALGLAEQRQEVIKCGRAGFASYVSRDASLDSLYTALSDVAAGRLACPPEISGGLLRALFQWGAPAAEEPTFDTALTQRESEVLGFRARAFRTKKSAWSFA